MSTDETVAKDLVETLNDGEAGYSQAADHLREVSPAIAATLDRFSAERRSFSQEIINMGAVYGDDVDESGSMVAGLHRGWMSLKDAVTGTDPDAVLASCVLGDEHAVSEYEKALNESDLSPALRGRIETQLRGVKDALNEVRALKAA